MKPARLVWVVLGLATFGLVWQVHSASQLAVVPSTTPPPKSSIIQFDKAADKQQFLDQNHLKPADLKPVPNVDAYVAPIKPAEVVAGAAHVHPNYEYHVLLTPNDPIYSDQWWLPNVAADAAWNTTTGSASVSIAVIDTGFALSHEDLANRWAENSGEEGMTQAGDRCWTGSPADKRTNHCDDDGDGMVDNWRGWDFANGDNDPSVGTTNPNGQYASHGTMTSGMAGAQGNNGKGGAGVNWNSKIMPLQAMNDDGIGYTNDISSAIVYAADHGVKVISLSLGSTAPDDFMRQQIDYAISKGVTVVAAAGNSNCACMVYPANFPEVVAVGATDQSDVRASFSSYGPNLDLMAPGSGSIRTTYWTPGNQTSAYTMAVSGTSISTPIVAGIASLVYSRLPEATPNDVARILARGSNMTAGMGGQTRTDLYGYGRINAAIVMQLASLASPNGVLLSTHNISLSGSGNSAPSLNSTCQAAVDATCDIRLTGPDGITQKLLGAKAVDQWGGANFYWNATGLGLTPGSWKVEAISTKDGQTTVLSADYLGVTL